MYATGRQILSFRQVNEFAFFADSFFFALNVQRVFMGGKIFFNLSLNLRRRGAKRSCLPEGRPELPDSAVAKGRLPYDSALLY